MYNLHDTDFYSWTQQQVELLKAGNLAALDITNLIDEIEDMGRSEKRELKNRLKILLIHLLKWQYQPELRGTSWWATIKEQREEITQCLGENPGLKPIIDDTLKAAYKIGTFAALKETGLKPDTFPNTCPWTFDQIMDPEFWPDAA
ncbi:hypothetical protein TI04_02975 [Achromatium sp. WMS2]|nr:hypothetical protein TI04_02975 [Achromatium sp. WMS2]